MDGKRAFAYPSSLLSSSYSLWSSEEAASGNGGTRNEGKREHVLAIHHGRRIKLSHVKYVYIIIIVGMQ